MGDAFQNMEGFFVGKMVESTYEYRIITNGGFYQKFHKKLSKILF